MSLFGDALKHEIRLGADVFDDVVVKDKFAIFAVPPY